MSVVSIGPGGEILLNTASTGQAADESYLMNLGVSVLQTEKKFNDAAGFKVNDDRLPEFFAKEQLTPSGLVFDISDEEVDTALEF